MGLRNNLQGPSGRRPAGFRARLKQTAFTAGLCTAAAMLQQPALADIAAGTSTLASKLDSSSSTTFDGGTLVLDVAKTYTRNFTFNDVSTNTIDNDGNAAIFSGKLTGDGPITITDSVGGGSLTLSNASNTYSGATTIESGALLALEDYGIISYSSGLTDNGTFDISASETTVYATSLDGSGSVVLGVNTLALSSAGGTFSGVISGTGGFTLASGTETLTGVNTYTGYTAITGGTLVLSGDGSIAASNGVGVYGILDLSAANDPTLASIYGSGNIALGDRTLTLTAGAGTFTGTISGSGGLILEGGTQSLSGNNTFTGGVTIKAGTLQLSSATIPYDIADNGTLAFYNTGTITMNGVVSGAGDLAQKGSGTTVVTAVQTYTGATTISAGTLSLSGSGSIAASSGVAANGTFDISNTAGTTIASLAGSGTVALGAETLTLTNASGDFSGTITGTGDLVIAGGTQTLSGTSTFTGTTTIAAGTLILRPSSGVTQSTIIDNSVLDVSAGQSTTYTGSISIASLAGDGAVTLGADTLKLTAAADTFAGVISGAGNLTVSGGTQTFSGANTYTGTTTVAANAGLALAATGSLDAAGDIVADGLFDVSAASGTSITFAALSGSGTVDLGAHTLTLTDASGLFAGTIQGTGGLVVSGGSQILTGANSYSGGTTVETGATLQLGNRSSTGSVAGDIVNNGTLAFDYSATVTVSGSISGTGALVQRGTGTTILTADNTYSGGTTITYGTLQIGDGGTSGSIVGDVTDNGTLAFARSDATTIGAVLSGTGGATFVSGTTTLTAVQDYTGATVIDSGATLVIGSTGSIAASRIVNTDGTFDVSAAASPEIASLAGGGSVTLGAQTLTLTAATGDFAGSLSGTGGVTLASGTETFTGANSYTGTTTIDGGTLAVNGSIAGSQNVTVNSGGTLTGTGTVSTVTVASGGTLSPGSAGAGTLTATGDVIFADGSTYAVGVTPASATGLTAAGTASLAGTLEVTSEDGTYLLGQKQTVLTADGGISGTFTLGEVTSTGAQFSSTLTYDANNVYLEIDLAKLSPLLPSDANANQTHAVGAIDAAIAAGDTLPQTFQDLGNVSSTELGNDATQLAGEIGADLPQVGTTLLTPLLDSIFDRLAGRPVRGNQIAVWAAAFDGTHSVAGDPDGRGTHKFRLNMAGFMAGASWVPLPNLVLGGAISAGSADFRLADTVGTGNADALQAALYGSYRFSRHFYGDFAAVVALNNITTRRSLTVSGDDTLKGKLTATVYGARYETGVLLGWITPYVAFQDMLSVLPSYTESASSGDFALHYAGRTINTGRLELGFRHSFDFALEPNWILTPNLTLHLTDRLAWAHDFFGASGTDAAFAALPSSGFTVYGAKPARDSALISVGGEFRFDNGWRFDTRLDSAFSSNAQTYTGVAAVSYRW